MTAWHDCTALQRDCLKAIADHDHYGRTATADSLQTFVIERRSDDLDPARVTEALRTLEDDDLVAVNEDTYSLTDQGTVVLQQAARSLAIAMGYDLVATDGGPAIRSRGAAADRLDGLASTAAPALEPEELATLEAIATYLREHDGYVVQAHAEPAIRAAALDRLAADDPVGAGPLVDTLAAEYGTCRTLTALLDLLVQGEVYEPAPGQLRPTPGEGQP